MTACARCGAPRAILTWGSLTVCSSACGERIEDHAWLVERRALADERPERVVVQARIRR